MLRLTVVSPQHGTMGEGNSYTFGRAGGTIGRSRGCDWTLPDPRYHLSARHASIRHDGAGYTITDTSTNGVFLNGQETALGRERSARLGNGDRLTLADYVIAVAVEGEAARRLESPERAADTAAASDARAFWDAVGIPPESLPDEIRERLWRCLGAAVRDAVALLGPALPAPGASVSPAADRAAGGRARP